MVLSAQLLLLFIVLENLLRDHGGEASICTENAQQAICSRIFFVFHNFHTMSLSVSYVIIKGRIKVLVSLHISSMPFKRRQYQSNQPM